MLFVTLFAVLLSTFTFVNQSPARGATVGSGLCAQTVDSNVGVSVTQVGNDCIVTFISGTNNNWTVPARLTTVRALVVGGGGGGGAWVGGGGGGGGFRDVSSIAVTPGSTVAVTVGAGGTPAISSGGQYNNVVGTNGGESKFGTILAAGGGKGGSHDPSGGTYSEALKPLVGGSGGGGTGRSNQVNAEYVTLSTGALGNTPLTSPSQGNKGGDGNIGSGWISGGGGGAGGAGGNATTSGGAGGPGASSNITGSTLFYAGGGGGIVHSSTTGAGAGGTGGGGNGTANGTGVSGTANTGGGGGGGGAATNTSTGGSGGSGVVVIRYALPADTLSLIDSTCATSVSSLSTLASTDVVIKRDGSYCFIAFKATGKTFTWTPPTGVNATNILTVAGGGGGGTRHAAGGGAGGLLQLQSQPVSSSLTIAVGAGGAGAPFAAWTGVANAYPEGSNGSNSTVSGGGITTQTAVGGGGGASDQATGVGGSGGGGTCCNASTIGTATSGQGNNGGVGVFSGSFYSGGGGGGAGSAGIAATTSPSKAGSGGAGAIVSWIPSATASALGVGQVSSGNTYFAGGGGGGTNGVGTVGDAGLGGGVAGGGLNTTMASATANTGGGGGGSGINSAGDSNAGSNGGSGVVVIRYALTSEILRFDATNPDSYTSGTTWNDLASAKNASLTNGTAFNSRAKAFDFDGTNDYVDLPDLTDDLSNGFSIHFVADFGAANSWERVFEFTGTGTAGSIALSRRGVSNSLILETYNAAGTSATWCETSGDIIATGFHSYSVVVQPNGTCQFYRNGVTSTTTGSASYASNVTRTDNNIGAGRGLSSFGQMSIQSFVMYNTTQVTPVCRPYETNTSSHKVLQFTTVGQCLWNVPAGAATSTALVVAGGGGGGGGQASEHGGGGGGAGGLLTPSLTGLTGQLTVTVGQGGSGGTVSAGNGAAGVNGSNSSISTSTATGGGGGGSYFGNGPGAGGSGGGAGNSDNSSKRIGASGSQGNSGGSVSALGSQGTFAAGGGGAGGPGASVTTTPGSVAVGGVGTASSITGTSTLYAGGGGGGGSTSGGAGGNGGGGNGGRYASGTGQVGAASFGGGGGGGMGVGGANANPGGAGGSGIVIVSYALPAQAALSITTTSAALGNTLTLATSGGTGSGAVTYAVTTAGTAGCSISGSTLSFTSAGTCTVTATKAAADGYASVSSSATTVTITSYTVTYDSKGGSSVASGTFGVGGSITEPTAPTRPGFAFAGWSATDGGVAVTWPYSPGVSSNITLYAKWTASQTVDSSLELAGTVGQYAQISDGQIIPATGAFTIQAWLKAPTDTSSNGTGMVFSQGPALGSRFYLYRNNQGTLVYDRGGASSTALCGTVPANTWQHVTITYNGTNTSTCYLNGVQQSTLVANNSIGTKFVVGALSYAMTDRSTHWKGSIDDVRVYNNVRSGTQIAADAHTYATVADSSLIAYYDFNEGSGTTAFNQKYGASSATNLTLSGSPTFADVAESSTVNGRTVKIFKRSYLNNTGGWTVPGDTASLDVLAVGGGGAGGSANEGAGGGGGGGRVLTQTGQALSGVLGIKIGQGGVPVQAAGASPGGDGGITSITPTSGTAISALGGSGGATGYVNTPQGAPSNTGYNGGGGSVWATSTSNGSIGAGGFSGGNPQGSGFSSDVQYGGGGGGAAANGANGSAGGGGGAGVSNAYATGSNLFYGGGGGGGKRSTTGGTGGAGGSSVGGAGGTSVDGSPASVNTGSGGGGAGGNAKVGGSGAAGIVVIRYGLEAQAALTITSIAGTTGSTLALTTSGGSGSGTVTFTATTGTAGCSVSGSTLSFTSAGICAVTATKAAADGYSAVSSSATTITITAAIYTVTYNYNNATGGNSTATADFTLGGTALTLPTPTRTGYAFNGWFEASNLSGSALGSTYSPTQTRTIYAKWTANTYTVTYNYDNSTGGNSTATADFTVGGSALTLPTPTRTGYTFAGWHSDSAKTVSVGIAGASYSPTASLTLYAKWTANVYTVTYNYDNATGGNSTATSSFTVDGTAITLPTPTRTGYTFDGWFEASNFSGSALSSTYSPTQSRTIYAKWTANVYTVTYNYDNATGGNSTATADFTVGGTAITLPTPTRTGYTFSGWHSDSGKTVSVGNAGASYSPTASLTLYAKWTSNPQAITYLPGVGGSGTGPTSPATVLYDASFSTPANTFTKTGYTFAGWSDGSEVFAAGARYPAIGVVTGPVSLIATWTANAQNITYAAGTGGSGTGPSSPATVLYDASFTTPANTFTKAGYTFAGWSDGTSVFAAAARYPASGGVTGPVTLTATWNAGTNTVIYDSKGGTSVSNGSFATGGSIANAPTPPTRTGYIFAGWSATDGGTAITFPYSPNATTGITLYARWTEITYTVTYDRNLATGTPERATDTYTYTGGGVILAGIGSMARTGYTFDGWQVSGSTTKLSSPYIPGANVTLEARWSAASYAITYFSNSGGTAPNADTYTTGNSALTLPTQGSMARTGYTFNGWSTTINNVSTKVGTTLTTAAPVNLFALWTAINYTVTYCEESTCSNAAALTGNVPTDANNYNIGNNVVVKANSGNLVRTGYSFAGWTTNSDGSVTGLQSGQTYTVQSTNINFYPVWTANTYTISYNVNGATGTQAAPSTSYITGNSPVTLSGVGSMAKTGHTFTGWSTDPLGTGQATATTTSDVTLFAIWTVDRIQYTYKFGTAGQRSVDDGRMAVIPQQLSDNAPYNSSVTLTASIDNLYTDVDNNNFEFFGWRDSIFGQTYDPNTSYLIRSTNPIDFVAQWVQILEVKYAFNGGTGSVGNTAVELECQQLGGTCRDGQVITLNTAPTRTGYTFTGWKDQNGADFVAGTTAAVTSSSFLFYAQWQAVPYTMTFNANGGNATVADQIKNIGQSFTFPSPGTRAGYDFNGWIRSDIMNSPTYGVGTTYVTGSSSIPFVASWHPRTYTVTYNWNGGVGSPTNPVSYTVDQSQAITLPGVTGHARDGYIFDGWSTTDNGTTVGATFRPTDNTLLFARWIDGAYTITFNNFNGLSNTSASVTRATALTLPTPTRTGFTFDGWYEDADYTLRYGAGGASVIPTATKTLVAKWTQNSLVGINPAHLKSLVELSMVAGSDTTWTGTHGRSGTGAKLDIPEDALPAGTKVSVSFVEDLTRPASLIEGNNAYFTSVVVHWLSDTGANATVPDATAGKPLSLRLTNPAIVAGAKVFKIVNGAVTEVATATVDGQVTITFTQDPEFVVAATRPGSPTAVTATNNQNAQSTVSWTAPLGNGGSSITGYTATASPGGANCTTAGTSCQFTGLTNGTSYTFTVKATNAIGDSLASSASSAITPRLAINYAVTFNSNGGSPVGNSSFVENGSLSAPTDPTRSGYNFIGWATTDGIESTIISFPYSPANADLTLYAIWRASNPALNPDNSGNNGAVITPISTKPSATPTPKASASAKPTTKATSSAKPTSSASPESTPEPIPTPKDPFANAPKPNAGIDTPNPGNANAIVGDASVETVVTVTEFAKQIEIGDSISISFQATDAAGNQLPTSPDGSVQVVQGATISASGTGFKPDSPVEAWLYSTPVLLGSGLANADGSFDNTYAIDSDFPLGDHTVVLHGISPTDEVITLALGVTVIADDADSSSNTLLIAVLAFLGALLTFGLWLVLRRRSGTHKK